MVRVELPQHLRTLARVGVEVGVEVNGPVTIGAVLDAIERAYPMLCGTIRDHVTRPSTSTSTSAPTCASVRK